MYTQNTSILVPDTLRCPSFRLIHQRYNVEKSLINKEKSLDFIGRYVLYEAAVSVVSHSPEFRSIHQYYTTREKNPLKKMQSMIAVACKLIRVFYLILQTGTTYDAEKLMSDIRRPVAA